MDFPGILTNPWPDFHESDTKLSSYAPYSMGNDCPFHSKQKTIKKTLKNSTPAETARIVHARRIGYKPRLLRQLFDTLGEELPLNWDEAFPPLDFGPLQIASPGEIWRWLNSRVYGRFMVALW